MIDYLICDQEKIGLKRSYILKVTNFLIFIDFLRIFVNFNACILIKYIRKIWFLSAC